MLAALFVVALLAGRTLLRAWFYPKPPAAVPVTSEPLDVLLARLETWLRTHAPAVAESLRPGLSDAQIDALEASRRLRLTQDLRTLYRWHDGADGEDAEFIPTYRFLPLHDAIRERAGLRDQVRSATIVQRIAFQIFAGHRAGWLPVLRNVSGDGYFYDPARRRTPGHFFFCVHDEFGYEYFANLADFVAAVIECFESGAFRPSAGGARLRWDIEKSIETMGRYSARRGS
jgi:cell wall assembly regulator SMI1